MKASDWLRQDPALLKEEYKAPSINDLFDEEPVNLTRFVTEKKYLNNPPLSDVQYEAVRHIERIYYEDLYPQMAEFDPYWAETCRMVNFITLQWGKGSGKDHICRVASLRIAYLLQCLKSPQIYFGMPEQDTLHMLNVASASGQAQQAFFLPVTRAVKRGWFEDKCEPKPGLGLITWKKNVEMVSGHADAESQEGLNLILGIADEIDAFRSKADLERYRVKSSREPTKSAEGILKMLRTSGSTRFTTYKTVRISYPRYLGSMIQQLTDQARKDNLAKGDKSRHYVSGPLATWEVNPRVQGKEQFEEDYDEDPAMARAMYECRPTRAVDTYFKNMDAVRAAFTDEVPPIQVEYVTRQIRSELTGTKVLSWEPSYTIDEDFHAVTGARYAMHADLAVKGDKAGVAMSHVVRYETITETTYDEEGLELDKSYDRPIVKTDFVITFAADAKSDPPREIQIRWARLLAFELIKRGFNIERLTFDGFQSVDSMQIIEGHGIETDRVSMDLNEDPWKNWRDLLYEGRHSMQFDAKLLEEIESLGRYAGKVDHPPAGSKDMADAVCGSILGAVILGGSESEDGETAYAARDELDVGYFDTDLAGFDAEDGFAMPLGFR